jgi:hypothetical protein
MKRLNAIDPLLTNGRATAKYIEGDAHFVTCSHKYSEYSEYETVVI